jgi:hypothetical protein
MSRIVDNLIAFRILTLLVKPFPETDAFRLGIIDKNGKNLVPSSKLSTEEEKDSYDYLHRLVFNLKKLINKLPGGDNKIKNIVAALFLIKEQLKINDGELISESKLLQTINLNVIFAEETLMVTRLLEDGEGPANVSMPADGSSSKVSTDIPAKRISKKIIRRQSFKPVAVDLNQRAL